MTFNELGLSAEVLRAVTEAGYTAPTPIQGKAIPVALSGKDILAAAQTGTGKTAAFTLPMLTKLQKHANTSVSPARHPIRALILTPTRELADQVSESVSLYNKHIPLRSLVVFGGVDMNAQSKALRDGVEILVATPGRLLDHIQQKSVNLSQVEMLVLDEADRMLDMGFILDIRKIISLCPANRQTLLFSATFSPEIKKLAAEFMREPDVIEVARPSSTNESVTIVMHAAESDRKRAILAHLIRKHAMNQVIVFCKTKQMTDRLGRDLARDGFAVEAIHGDRSQQGRLETLAGFKEGRIKVLVATDVAARGLDIQELPFVVNFELPGNPEDFVHRIGRTGRAGATGIAISLVAPEEEKYLEAIRKLIKKPLVLEPVSDFVPNEGRGPRREAASAPSSTAPQRSYSRHADFDSSKLQAAIAAMPVLRKEVPRQIPALLLPPRYPIETGRPRRNKPEVTAAPAAEVAALTSPSDAPAAAPSAEA